MTVSLLRASAASLLFCAACGSGSDPTTSTSSGSGGSGGGSTTSASSSASGTGGSMPAAMDCELTITDVSGANVNITAFSASHAQGAEKHPQGDPIQYGFAAGDSTEKGVVKLLNIGVSGPMLTQGMTYSLDDKGSILELTINDTGGADGEKDWKAAPGSKMTVDAITPGVVSGYRNVTFGLTNVGMVVDVALGAGNKATGTFKMSGKCLGAVTNYQGP
ncbi:MAG: hypothetical protein ABJE95_32440 [Byssovorax sp.]